MELVIRKASRGRSKFSSAVRNVVNDFLKVVSIYISSIVKTRCLSLSWLGILFYGKTGDSMIFSLCHSKVRAVHRGSASRCNFVAAWNANHESCRALTLGNLGALEVFRSSDVCVLWGSLLRTLMAAICEINDHAEGLIFYLLNERSKYSLRRQANSI